MLLVYLLIFLACIRVGMDLPYGSMKLTFKKDAGSYVVFSVLGGVNKLTWLLVAHFFLPSFLYKMILLIGIGSLSYSIFLSSGNFKNAKNRVGMFWYLYA